MNQATVDPSTFLLRGPSGALVPAAVSYDTGSRTATLDPQSPLDDSTRYTATVKGGSTGVKDRSDNALAADVTWSFTTAAAPPPPPDEGPGGPILVISKASNPFTPLLRRDPARRGPERLHRARHRQRHARRASPASTR